MSDEQNLPDSDSTSLIPLEEIQRRIFIVRRQKVMLDSGLALMYGVKTLALNQAVKRNIERFPGDFMLNLSHLEAKRLISQFVISNGRHLKAVGKGRGGRRKKYHAFTEQGVAMLSSVLRSPRAVRVNIEIMRAFVRMRQLLASHADLAAKIDELESKYDHQFKAVFHALRQLIEPPKRRKEPFGFKVDRK